MYSTIRLCKMEASNQPLDPHASVPEKKPLYPLNSGEGNLDKSVIIMHQFHEVHKTNVVNGGHVSAHIICLKLDQSQYNKIVAVYSKSCHGGSIFVLTILIQTLHYIKFKSTFYSTVYLMTCQNTDSTL